MSSSCWYEIRGTCVIESFYLFYIIIISLYKYSRVSLYDGVTFSNIWL